MKKGMGVGDAVFIKLIEDNTNAVNKADVKKLYQRIFDGQQYPISA